jgi:DNA-binding transcriptional ArsR family regulator
LLTLVIADASGRSGCAERAPERQCADEAPERQCADEAPNDREAQWPVESHGSRAIPDSAAPDRPAGGTTGDLADVALRAVAEPRRRAILELVARQELAAGEIASAFDVTRTAVSQHLTVLKKAGLLSERRDGTRRLYRARPEGVDQLRQLLDGIWASSLDVARRLVEADRGVDRDDQTDERPARAG